MRNRDDIYDKVSKEIDAANFKKLSDQIARAIEAKKTKKSALHRDLFEDEPHEGKVMILWVYALGALLLIGFLMLAYVGS